MNITGYTSAYKALNDDWFSRLSEYTQFCQIDKDMKLSMLRDFNELYAGHINTNQHRKSDLLDFLTSNKIKNKYIVKWENHHLSIYNCAKLNVPDTIYAEVRDNYITLEFFDAECEVILEVSCRLHTAKKDITKNLSIKYDTKIANMERVYDLRVI